MLAAIFDSFLQLMACRTVSMCVPSARNGSLADQQSVCVCVCVAKWMCVHDACDKFFRVFGRRARNGRLRLRDGGNYFIFLDVILPCHPRFFVACACLVWFCCSPSAGACVNELSSCGMATRGACGTLRFVVLFVVRFVLQLRRGVKR